MSLFPRMEDDYVRHLTFFDYPEIPLKAVLALPNPSDNPSLALVRVREYENMEEMVENVISVAGSVHLGCNLMKSAMSGGSLAVWCPPSEKKPVMFRALGRLVDRLGTVLLSSDMGCDYEDLLEAGKETDMVIGFPPEYGGIVDPTLITAHSIYLGIRTLSEELLKSPDMDGLKLLVYGMGRVGTELIKIIKAKCPLADIVISDRSFDRIKQVQDDFPEIVFIQPDEVLSYPCDILIPCGAGGFIGNEDIDGLRCKIIAGSALRPLGHVELEEKIYRKGVVLAPDFLLTAGRIIQLDGEIAGIPEETIFKKLSIVPLMLSRFITDSLDYKIPLSKVARDHALYNMRQQARLGHV